jgi:hypothetical protein
MAKTPAAPTTGKAVFRRFRLEGFFVCTVKPPCPRAPRDGRSRMAHEDGPIETNEEMVGGFPNNLSNYYDASLIL